MNKEKITNTMMSDLKDRYIRVCYFSPEMYYTQGAIFYVVLKMQMYEASSMIPCWKILVTF